MEQTQAYTTVSEYTGHRLQKPENMRGKVARSILKLAMKYGVSRNKALKMKIGWPLALFIDDEGDKPTEYDFENIVRNHLMEDMGESFKVDPCDSLWDILHNNGH